MDTRLTSIFLSMTLIMGLNSLERESHILLTTKITLFIFLIIDQVIYFHANQIFIDNKSFINLQKPLEKVIDLFLGSLVMITALFWARYIYFPSLYFLFFFLANLFGLGWWYLFRERCNRYNNENKNKKILESVLKRFVDLHIASLIISFFTLIFIFLVNKYKYFNYYLNENTISITSVIFLFFAYLIIIISKYDDIFKLLDSKPPNQVN